MEQRDLQILNDKEPKKSSKKASLKLKKPSKLKTVRNTAQGDEELLKAENPMPAENSLSQALALQEEPAQEAPAQRASARGNSSRGAPSRGASARGDSSRGASSRRAKARGDSSQKAPAPQSPPQEQQKTHYDEDNPLAMALSKQFQMRNAKSSRSKNPSPMHIHLIQSESLRVAQDKIKELEEELIQIRKHNESVLSASEILKSNNVSLKQDLENIEHKNNEQKNSFKEEKEILMSALSSAKENIDKLKAKNKELDKKISGYFYNLRNRESSLEGRIEILKMENSILQREKDNKILKFKKDIENNKYKMESLHKENQELKALLRKLKDSSSRAVSALRATVFNLEGAKEPDNTIFTKDNLSKK